MKLDLDNRQSDIQIEILPMIDVIFCILTFFILAAVGLTRQQAIALDLPAVNNSAPVEGTSGDRLYVSIDSAGQIYVDRSPVPALSLLYDVLLQHQQLAPNGTVVLYASRSARYEDVIQVLDLLRTVGGDRVALATLPADASLDPTQGTTQSPEDLLGGQAQPDLTTPGLPSDSEFGRPQRPADGDLFSPEGLPPIDPLTPGAPSPSSPLPEAP